MTVLFVNVSICQDSHYLQLTFLMENFRCQHKKMCKGAHLVPGGQDRAGKEIASVQRSRRGCSRRSLFPESWDGWPWPGTHGLARGAVLAEYTLVDFCLLSTGHGPAAWPLPEGRRWYLGLLGLVSGVGCQELGALKEDRMFGSHTAKVPRSWPGALPF